MWMGNVAVVFGALSIFCAGANSSKPLPATCSGTRTTALGLVLISSLLAICTLAVTMWAVYDVSNLRDPRTLPTVSFAPQVQNVLLSSYLTAGALAGFSLACLFWAVDYADSQPDEPAEPKQQESQKADQETGHQAQPGAAD